MIKLRDLDPAAASKVWDVVSRQAMAFIRSDDIVDIDDGTLVIFIISLNDSPYGDYMLSNGIKMWTEKCQVKVNFIKNVQVFYYKILGSDGTLYTVWRERVIRFNDMYPT